MAKKTKETKAKKKHSEKKPIRFTECRGEMRLFGEEVEFKKNGKKESFWKFGTSIGAKDDNGNYHNVSIPVTFRKDEEPEQIDCQKINVKSGFWTVDFYESKDGEEIRRAKIVVLEWEEVKDDEDDAEEDEDDEDDDDMPSMIEIPDGEFDDLPF